MKPSLPQRLRLSTLLLSCLALSPAMTGPAAAAARDSTSDAETSPQSSPFLQRHIHAAKAGSVEAMLQLGITYFTGNAFLDIPKDIPTALKWLNRAADAGNIRAQGLLGEIYNAGEDVTQDYAKARYWYEHVIAKNDPAHTEETGEALNNLGEMYRRGDGVKKDYPKALSFYERALNYPSIRSYANFNIGKMYEHGQGVKQDYSTARQSYEKSANEHMGHAEQRLGWFYQKGLGVTADKNQARQWYQKACSDGYQQACQGG